MISLRKILNESLEESRVLDLLRSGDFFGVETPLYRGVNSTSRYDYETADFAPIRKDRKPRDTDHFIDFLIEHIRMEHYSDFPSRRRSVFATGKRKEATSYGDHLLRVFPRKDANVMYLPKDSLVLFGNAMSLYEQLQTYPSSHTEPDKFIESEKLLNDPELRPFFDLFENIQKDQTMRVVNIIKDNYELLDDYEFYNRAKSDPMAAEIIKLINEMMIPIVSYFKMTKPYVEGISSRRIGELIIEDDDLLVANEDWFKKNIESKLS